MKRTISYDALKRGRMKLQAAVHPRRSARTPYRPSASTTSVRVYGQATNPHSSLVTLDKQLAADVPAYVAERDRQECLALALGHDMSS
jgi:hypothetical protein